MRAKTKGPFIDSLFIRKKLTYRKDSQHNPYKLTRSPLIVRSRRSTILPFLENTPVKVYNGQRYVLLQPQLGQIGHKFGDFVLTKKKCVFRSKSKKKGK